MDVKVSESAKRKPSQLLELAHGPYRHYDPPLTVVAPFTGEVVKVHFKEGMEVEKGQSMFLLKAMENLATESVTKKAKAPIRAVAVEDLDPNKPLIKIMLERIRNSHTGIFTMENVFMDQNAGDNPMAALDNEDVQNRYKSFKKFDSLADHSGHLFSMHNSPMNQPKKRWANNIKKEWKILKKNLPDTIFVRVYESRMDILRAAIIGPKKTPYHDGLFFFDVHFPRSYPKSPPRVWYHSGGLAINPNLLKSGRVQLTLPKTTDSSQMEESEIWVPGTSNILNLLISIQNQILITKPYYNYLLNARTSSMYKQHSSLLYNENTFLKSLKTMVYIMNKPPKNFENLVVGHFRNRVRDILMACKAYMEGVQVGCLGVQEEEESGENEASTIEFRNDVASCTKLLVAAFIKIGAKEAEEFLPLF